MGDITKPPLGLLDLLGRKSVGSNPSILEGDISGGVALLDLYLLNARLQFASTITINNSSTQTLDHTVPSGKIWVVYSYGLTFTPLAAGNQGIQMGFIDPSSQFFPTNELQFMLGGVVGQVNTLNADLPSPFWAESGVRFAHRQTSPINSNRTSSIVYRELEV